MGGRIRCAVAGLAFLSSMAVVADAEAARHRLNRIGDDSVDLVMSVGWNFDGSGPGNRTYLTNALRTFAEQTYTMTEGRLQICNVYVFKDGKGPNADISASPGSGRADTIGSLRGGFGAIRSFLKQSDESLLPPEFFGRVLAHEFGHYGLFLLDEYIERSTGLQRESEPRRCDVTLETIMGSSRYYSSLSMPSHYDDAKFPAWTKTGVTNQELKYKTCDGLTEPTADAPGTEDAKWRTAQYRHWRRSAWELLANGPDKERLGPGARDEVSFGRFPSITTPGMPSELTRPRLPDDNCHRAIFMDGTFAVLLLDRSFSMSEKLTPGGTKTHFDLAKERAAAYVSSAPPGTTIAVMTFADDGEVVVTPTLLGEADLKQKQAAIINGFKDLTAAPMVTTTNIDRALVAAAKVFDDNAEVGNTQYMITLSDGITKAAAQFEAPFRRMRIPIFTQQIGRGAGAELQEVADQTNGAHRGTIDSAWGHNHIADRLLTHEQLSTRTFPRPAAHEPLEPPIHVNELDGATSFRATWPVDSEVAFQLKAPDGTVITPLSLPPGVTYEPASVGAIFRVERPAPGVWTPVLTPAGAVAGDLRVDALSASAFTFTVDVTGYGRYPDPWFLRATLRAPNPVVGARVVAKLTKPGAPAFELGLRDDGEAPDAHASDGVYTGVLSRVVEDGNYALEVVADNPGAAHLAPIADEGATPSMTPKPLPTFLRQRSFALSATGYRPMPQSRAGAIKVRNDFTPVWGTIDRPGEVVWFEFNGFANGHYAAMTGELISNDGAPMKTRLTLVDRDGSTVLTTNAEDDGRAFVELRTPSTGGEYFLKVDHPSGGVGRFRLAVAPRDWFNAKETPKPEADGGCGCRAARSSEGLPWIALGLLSASLARRRGGARRTASVRGENA